MQPVSSKGYHLGKIPGEVGLTIRALYGMVGYAWALLEDTPYNNQSITALIDTEMHQCLEDLITHFSTLLPG